jgi:predicted alpha-1,2-mannosidase
LITGFRKSTGWAKDQHVFFAMVFSEPLNDYMLTNGRDTLASKEITGKEVRGIFKFPSNIRPLLLKVGVSSANTEGAIENITHDLPDWNFNAVKSEAGEMWNSELSKIRAKLIEPELDTVFYSALYHTSLAPALYSDINNQYKAVDSTTWTAKSFDRYTVFSLWDTFRATHPLFTITQPKRTRDFLQSILSFYDESGLLPVWALAGNETNTMTGYHAVPVLADAIYKGYLKGEEERAYQAMVASAQQNIRGTNYYREYGYIPADLDGWSVTKTLEYSFDDWCIAQVAKKLNKPEDYQYYMERAGNYKNLFNAASGFMRARLSDGNWLEPFDPFHSEHGFDGMYIEGTAWQHTWFVPHDVKGLIELYGSEVRFLNFLDSTFQVSSAIKGENASIDITGLIGQYAHGNEPSHHISYLYNYAGKPWKTQKIVRQIMAEMYKNDVDGLPGNEDCGQMSAWYIFSALGFYPVNPAEGIYVICSPLIKKASIDVGVGTFDIIAENNSPENIYVQEVYLNEKPLDKSYIKHEDIVNGGQMRFVMGNQPNKNWATSIESRPPSMTKY